MSAPYRGARVAFATVCVLVLCSTPAARALGTTAAAGGVGRPGILPLDVTAVLPVSADAGRDECLATEEIPVEGLELTDEERSLLPFVCWPRGKSRAELSREIDAALGEGAGSSRPSQGNGKAGGLGEGAPGRGSAIPPGGLRWKRWDPPSGSSRGGGGDPSPPAPPPPFPPAPGIPEGVDCDAETWCDAVACAEVCARGSVRLPPGMGEALSLQRRLSSEVPLCWDTLPGTHNSGISLADGYGNRDRFFQHYFKYVRWALPSFKDAPLRTNDQWLSLTDQMRLGVRAVELDTHWVAGELRVAHCGGLHVPELNAMVKALNTILRLLGRSVRWDTETLGCSPSLSSIAVAEQRTVSDAFGEIKAFIDSTEAPAAAPPGDDGRTAAGAISRGEAEADFWIIYFDDQRDLASWGKLKLLQEQITTTFPEEWIYSAEEVRADLELTGGAWPSRRELRGRGKRLAFISGTDYGRAAMDPLLLARGDEACGWWEPGLSGVLGAPACSAPAPGSGSAFPRPQPRRALGNGTWSRVFACELLYGPFDCEFKWGEKNPALDEGNIPGVLACDAGQVAPDLLTTARAQGWLWTWADGEPLRGATPSAATGRRRRDGSGGSDGDGDDTWTALDRRNARESGPGNDGPGRVEPDLAQGPAPAPGPSPSPSPRPSLRQRIFLRLTSFLRAFAARWERFLGWDRAREAYSTAGCAVLDARDGRWRAVVCASDAPSACRVLAPPRGGGGNSSDADGAGAGERAEGSTAAAEAAAGLSRRGLLAGAGDHAVGRTDALAGPADGAAAAVAPPANEALSWPWTPKPPPPLAPAPAPEPGPSPPAPLPPSPGSWILSFAGRGECPTGTSFDVPRHPGDSLALSQTLARANVSRIWLPVLGPTWDLSLLPSYTFERQERKSENYTAAEAWAFAA